MAKIKRSIKTTVQYIPEYYSAIKADYDDSDPWACSDDPLGPKSKTLKQAYASLEAYAAKYPVREYKIETRVRIVTTTVEILPGLGAKLKKAGK